MQKISDSTNTANASGEYTEGNPAAGVDATLLKAQWLNAIQRELVGLVLGAGILLNTADDTQVLKAVKKLASDVVEANKLGFTPVQQGTGIGQKTNTIKIGHSSSGVKLTVDLTDFGTLWYSGNFDPNTKANWSSSLSAYGITDAYTKSEVDSRVSAKPQRDSIINIGLASNDVTLPYMRRESDGQVYYLQPRLGFSPVQQGTGVGQSSNTIKIGQSPTGVRLTVDVTDFGTLWYSGNFDPNTKANWGSSLSAYGITNAYTKTEVDTLVSSRPVRDGITHIGFAGNDAAQPYMRRESDGSIYNLINDQNINAKIAGMGLSAIGTYAFARPITANGQVNQGVLVAGTSLLFSSTSEGDGSVSNSGLINVGTWRAHGALSGTARSLFQRVS